MKLAVIFNSVGQFLGARTSKLRCTSNSWPILLIFGTFEMVRKTKEELPTAQRMAVFLLLWQSQVNGRPANGSVQRLAIQFDVDKSTITRLWRATKIKLDTHLNVQNGAPINNQAVHALIHDIGFHESRRKLSGVKPKWDVHALQEAVRAMPFSDRQTVAQLSKNLSVPRSTLRSMFKTGHFRHHTSALKPFLTEQNKVSRVAYALEEIDGATLGGVVQFKDMFDRVDIDEKWFYQTKDGTRYILTSSEQEELEREPHRTISHKSHITKVMFLCAQARPRWDPHLHTLWDGKIGIWPIGAFAPAQRASINRPAGTAVWHDETINQVKYRELLLQKVFPAIMTKWPRGEWGRPNVIIRVQQDGAPSHIRPNDPALLQGLQQLGIHNKVLLYTQPSNSPDTNINDLGFFRALQSEYYKMTPGNAEQIIQCVQQAYNAYDKEKINRIWLSLMGCLNEIIDHHGNNDYEIPHMGKDRLIRINQLPTTIPVCDLGVELV